MAGVYIWKQVKAAALCVAVCVYVCVCVCVCVSLLCVTVLCSSRWRCLLQNEDPPSRSGGNKIRFICRSCTLPLMPLLVPACFARRPSKSYPNEVLHKLGEKPSNIDCAIAHGMTPRGPLSATPCCRMFPGAERGYVRRGRQQYPTSRLKDVKCFP